MLIIIGLIDICFCFCRGNPLPKVRSIRFRNSPGEIWT